MKNSRFSFIIIIRVLLISLNSFAVVWLIMNTHRPATTLFVIILLILQIIGLINYNNRIMRDLANFLVFLEENDTTLAFSQKRIERSFRGLMFQLNKLNSKLQTAHLEREKQFQYLQMLVKQIDTGIIAYDNEGRVEIFNHAARELLGIRSLTNINVLVENYPELAGSINPDKRSFTSAVKIKSGGNEQMLSVKLGSLRFDTRMIRIMSLQNIKPELEAGELDAWRKLIRIQRHEIINSLTPLTTLTTAIKRRFTSGNQRIKAQQITEEHIEDMLKSIDVIEERSRGLIDFMERYKGLTDIPSLKMNTFRFGRIITDLTVLFSRELKTAGIELITEITPADLMIRGDEKLLEQVMINLVKNSLEAIRGPGGKILINIFINNANQRIIQVIDNGSGIEDSALEIIFVPSYTTKEQGSGIGLSITRQIVQLHKGTIRVRSKPGIETIFEITLPK